MPGDLWFSVEFKALEISSSSNGSVSNSLSSSDILGCTYYRQIKLQFHLIEL